MDIKSDPYAPKVTTSGFANIGTPQGNGYTGLTYTPPPPQLQAPCPSCGYCPHCGRGGGHQAYPYITYTTPRYTL